MCENFSPSFLNLSAEDAQGQSFHVLPHLSVAENVALPLLLQGRPDPARVTALLQASGFQLIETMAERAAAQVYTLDV